MPKDLRQELIQALRDTWQAVGPDVLGAPEENQTLHRETVMDMVAECLYFQEYHAAAAIKLFRRMTPDEKTVLMKEAFPDEVYGW
jgi:hypothetical protein